MQLDVEVGDGGEIATYIFLLLAMDATTLRGYNRKRKSEKGFCVRGPMGHGEVVSRYPDHFNYYLVRWRN